MFTLDYPKYIQYKQLNKAIMELMLQRAPRLQVLALEMERAIIIDELEKEGFWEATKELRLQEQAGP